MIQFMILLLTGCIFSGMIATLSAFNLISILVACIFFIVNTIIYAIIQHYYDFNIYIKMILYLSTTFPFALVIIDKI